LRILIVDDERLICEWLQFCIKENPEYEIVGIANNGEQALKMYKEFEPDLVLSDIKMPVMDGLTMLKEVKKINSSAFVILLTAFSDFNYVREAMRENADEYILKTEISNHSFQEMLVRIGNKIKVKNRQNDDDAAYNGQKHSIIRNILISEKQITENDINKLKECNIKWRNTGIFAIAVWKKKLLDNFTVPKYEHVEHVRGVEYDELVYILVGNISKELSDLEKLYSLSEYTNKIMSDNNCMAGISNISNSLTNVNETVQEAVNSLSLGFYKDQIKMYQPISSNKKYRNENEKFDMELKHFYQEFYVITGKEQYLFFNKILDYIEMNEILQIKYIKTFCKECLDVIYLRYVNDNTEFSNESLIQTKAQIDEAVCFSEMKRFALKYAAENIWNNDINEKNLSQSIFKAVIFIQQHFNEAISLDQIASEVNLNPEYLSRIFKEETGHTYSSFLSNIRLKKAEHLLINTMEKVQNIAEKVGYSNVSYFSTIYKKKYGMNPYEYRRNNANKYVNYDKKIF